VLCELWGRGRLPFLNMPVVHGDHESDLLLQVCQNGWRPPVPAGMPLTHAVLMQRCWAAAPEARPTFVEVCEELEAATLAQVCDKLEAVTPQAPPRDRARLVLRYHPSVLRDSPCIVLVTFAMDSAAEQAAAATSRSGDGVMDADGVMTVKYIFYLAAGESCVLELLPADTSQPWLGSARSPLVLGGPEAAVTLQPFWGMAPELPQCGARAALRVRVTRATAAANPSRPAALGLQRGLGALSLLLAPRHTHRPPRMWPAACDVVAMGRLPAPLQPAKRTDIMLSYRDAETGFRSAKQFAFKLEAELIAAGYSVFCCALRRCSHALTRRRRTRDLR
jgi:hypothetical protein